MTLASGTRLGPYEIVAPLGAGGMGEVYRAHDPRLGREVAVKLVLAGAAHDPDRLRRFEQEARATSALNHPNLLTVFDFGSHDGQPFLVTELLEGRTLRAALEAGEAIALRTAVDWGAQIARGLAAAHEKGIVHRDLKPENLFVTVDGRVKILDFGLAKLTLGDESTLASATTLAGGATASGVILGTAGYMAPEQVRGEKVDAKADLFSLGCVLYELFGGRRAFHGETAIESLNAILKEEPRPLSELRADLPPALARLVERCLEKNPARRFQGAADLAWALESGGASVSSAAAPAVRPAPVRGARVRGAVAGLALGLLVGAGGALLLRGSSARSDVSWTANLLVGGAVLGYAPRISPDGSTLAFVLVTDRQAQVAVMQPGSGRWTVLTRDRSRGPVLSLCWSRDGRQIYFHRPVPNAVYSVPALGGDERLVLDGASRPEALGDGTLLVERPSGRPGTIRLFRHRPDRGETVPIGPEFVDLTMGSPGTGARVFADGREAIFFGILTGEGAAEERPGLYAIDLESGAARPLAPDLELPLDLQLVQPALVSDPRTGEILVAIPEGDLYRVVALPRSGSGARRTLLYLSSPPWFLDAGSDGSLYVDQLGISGHVLRFPSTGGSPSTVARFSGRPDSASSPVDLPDGSVLFSSMSGGRSALYRGAPGRDPVPFVESEGETSGPAALLPGGQVAFLIDSGGGREIALATPAGQIVKRYALPAAGRPSTLAAFGSGSLLYGVADQLYEIALDSGVARPLIPAAAGALDPVSGGLVIRGPGGRSDRIVRYSRDGRELSQLGPFPQLFNATWNGTPVDGAGRLLLTIGPVDSWYVGPAIVDERSLRPIPLEFEGDVFSPSWGLDGSILATGWEYTTGIWRYRPAAPPAAGRPGSAP